MRSLRPEVGRLERPSAPPTARHCGLSASTCESRGDDRRASRAGGAMAAAAVLGLSSAASSTSSSTGCRACSSAAGRRSARSCAARRRRRPPRYNLVVPRSACPACGHRIGALREHPGRVLARAARQVLGLRHRISARYPIVELLGGRAGRAGDRALRPDLAGPRGVRIAVDAARADVHRLRHAAPARRPHAAAAVGRACS